jgi:hypothetical protein
VRVRVNVRMRVRVRMRVVRVHHTPGRSPQHKSTLREVRLWWLGGRFGVGRACMVDFRQTERTDDRSRITKSKSEQPVA